MFSLARLCLWPVLLLGSGCGSYDWCARLNLDCAAAVSTQERPAVVDADGDVWIAASAGGGDCDDSRADVYPGAPEVCDGVDNDCNGLVDDGGVGEVGYRDADADAYGDPEIRTVLCSGPESGWALNDRDCDDTSSRVYPGAPERCDDLDNDCDGLVDEGIVFDHFRDQDDDGYGEDATATAYCIEEVPAGWVSAPGDCDDTTALASPAVEERCQDGLDNDCDGTADEEVCVAPGAWLYLGTYGAQIGLAVAGGDLSGDGVVDLVVGAPYTSNARAQDGAIYVVHGPVSADTDLSRQETVMVGDQLNELAGRGVAVVGDVDGDGSSDLLVGSPGRREGAYPEAGAAYLFLGPVTGAFSAASADAVFPGDRSNLRYGWAVAAVGDLDGDSVTDLLVGGANATSRVATLHSGMARGLTPVSTGLAQVLLENSSSAGRTRYATADFNSDGRADLLVGDPASALAQGAVYGVLGPLTGDVAVWDAPVKRGGEVRGDQAGHGLAAPGDVNGDGHDDLVVGAPGQDAEATDSGVVYLLYGPLSGTASLSAADGVWRGTTAGDRVGIDVAGAGDVDGDGWPEILIGTGRQGADPDDTAQVSVSIADGDVPVFGLLEDAEQLRHKVQSPTSTDIALLGGLDLTGDGVPDLIMGAPGHGGFEEWAGGVRTFPTLP